MQTTVNIKQLKTNLICCIKAGMVPVIHSSPGVGKSALIREISEELKLVHRCVHTGSMMPEDINGLPKINTKDKLEFITYNEFPMETDELPEGKQGYCLFLDELSSATKDTQKVLYQLILDKTINNKKLHKNTFIVAALNKETDKAIFNTMSTALASRVIHFFLEPTKQEFIDYLVQNNFDHRIVAFVEFRPDLIMNFNPESKSVTFACPRTWEFLNKIIQHLPNKTVDNTVRAIIEGTIGQGVSAEFISFCSIYSKLPTLKQVLADPVNCKLPDSKKDLSALYAMCGALSSEVNLNNISKIITYISRIEAKEIKLLFARMTNKATNKLLDSNDDWIDFIYEFSK